MNHKFLSLLACMALVFSAKALEAGDANIYASGLKVKGNNIEFMLNATPKLLTVNFYHESSLIHSLVIDNGVKGLNKVSLLGVFEDILPNTPLSWEVVVEADSHTSTRSFSAFAAGVAQLSEGGDVSAETWSAAAALVPSHQKMHFPYSIAVDKSPESPNFGNIYVLNDAARPYGSTTLESGVYVYDAGLNRLNNSALSEGLPLREAYFASGMGVYVPVSPYAVTVDEEGYVFVADNSSHTRGGGIYVASPDNLSHFELLIPAEDEVYFQDLIVTGKGNDRVLWVVNESGSVLLKYNIGDMTASSYDVAAQCSMVKSNEYVSNENVANNYASYPARICSDKRGGVWVMCGNQSNTGSGNFWLNHMNANGIMDFGGGDSWGVYANTAEHFALMKKIYDLDTNHDGSVLTVAICGTLASYDISFSHKGLPLFGDSSILNGYGVVLGADALTSPYGREGNSLHPVTTGVAYDAVGNLYATDISGYFQAFAPAKYDNSFTTKAFMPLVVIDAMTGIADVAADVLAPVEYFNLQGVKVESPENGIFIRKQGDKVSKVIF